MSAAPDLPEDDLHAYIDGALPAERRAHVERLIADHPDVARHVAALQAQRRALRDALAPIAAEPVPEALDLGYLLAKIRDRVGAPACSPPSRSFPQWSPWRAAAAAVVMLVIGGIGGWVLRGASAPSPFGLAALGAEASAAYAVYASDDADPVAFRSDDRAELIRWISDRLHRPVTPPDLTASGYRFVGGRLVATTLGPAGMFMYDDRNGIRLVVMTRPMKEPASTAMKPDDRGDTRGYVWSNGPMGFCLVGPTMARSLHEIADEIRRQTSKAV